MTAIEDARAWVANVDYQFPDVKGAVSALRALIAEHEATLSEMHHRELHHFETEKLLTEAGIDPDATPPTDDEREALAGLRYTVHGGARLPDGVHRVGYPAADAILASGFRRQGPITDEMVEAVWRTLELDEVGHLSRSNVRAALEAAERAR